jgi:hypothetical protein
MSDILKAVNWAPGPVRFDADLPAASKVWEVAENLIDFGGKGHRVIHFKGNLALVEEDSQSQDGWAIASKVGALFLLTLSVVGIIALAATLVYQRKQCRPLKVIDPILRNMIENGCNEVLSAKLETYHNIFFDGSTYISDEQLAFMESLKLKDMQFEVEDNQPEFKIVDTASGKSLAFSNRLASRGELRGQVLRERLSAKAEENGELSLTAALQQIITSKDSDMYTYTQPPLKGLINPNQEPKLAPREDLVLSYMDAYFDKVKKAHTIVN